MPRSQSCQKPSLQQIWQGIARTGTESRMADCCKQELANDEKQVLDVERFLGLVLKVHLTTASRSGSHMASALAMACSWAIREASCAITGTAS